MEVSVPAGIDTGMRIRSAGNGEPGLNGGPNGDLFVEVGVKNHHVFEREDDDLHCEAPVSFAKSALGGSIDVPTLNGKASFEVPEGTQSGKTFRLRGKGMPNVRSGVFGDLYCHVVLETPVNLTEYQRKLLRSLMNQLIKIKKGIIRTAKVGWTKLKSFLTDFAFHKITWVARFVRRKHGFNRPNYVNYPFSSLNSNCFRVSSRSSSASSRSFSF